MACCLEESCGGNAQDERATQEEQRLPASRVLHLRDHLPGVGLIQELRGPVRLVGDRRRRIGDGRLIPGDLRGESTDAPRDGLDTLRREVTAVVCLLEPQVGRPLGQMARRLGRLLTGLGQRMLVGVLCGRCVGPR